LQGFAEQNEPRIQSAYMLASTRPAARPKNTLYFNFANLYARARVVYVSSGLLPLARRMIDDDGVTAFSFSSTDPHPTAIIELARTQQLHRVSAVYQMEGGRLDVYLLNDLRGDGTDLLNAKPVASIVNGNGGKAAVDFEPHGARYVALRWTRQDGHNEAFEVAEVGELGELEPPHLATDPAASTMKGREKNGERLLSFIIRCWAAKTGPLMDQWSSRKCRQSGGEAPPRPRSRPAGAIEMRGYFFRTPTTPTPAR